MLLLGTEEQGLAVTCTGRTTELFGATDPFQPPRGQYDTSYFRVRADVTELASIATRPSLPVTSASCRSLTYPASGSRIPDCCTRCAGVRSVSARRKRPDDTEMDVCSGGSRITASIKTTGTRWESSDS
eukprot:3053712-Rhodomonas_salina.1